MMFTYIPISSLKKVFEGALNFSDIDGDNLVIPFQTPYRYNGKNLVVCIYKEDSRAESFLEDFYFYGKLTMATVKNISWQAETEMDLYDIDPQQGSAGLAYLSTYFLKRSDINFYNVDFKVVDANNQPVENATITFNGVQLEPGIYRIDDIPEGTYSYKAVLGDLSSEGKITIDGEDVEKTIILNATSNESNNNSMIRVYPNPNNGKFFVENAENSKEICIYDIYGKLVRKYNKINSKSFEIDLTRQRSGLYLLTIDGNAFKITKR